MALDRFYIPVAGSVSKQEALSCGFSWLLGRPETNLHIAFHKLDILVDVLSEMASMYPRARSVFDTLKKDRVFTFPDGKRLTCAPWRPAVQATPNGACLVIWAGLDELAAVEAKLGPVGTICAMPWGLHEIQNWIDAHTATPVDCGAQNAPVDLAGESG